ncbi:hypothetical protein C5167_011286 [Papaver somniferum]|uniref:Uncharacterized protein n=1 Tax=Papaver somniferum TaxID=3469 RepID=A0A4Y7K6G8_PAPSO|nr:hypothetical protein C5167_011286 [Papaver somniferum]
MLLSTKIVGDVVDGGWIQVLVVGDVLLVVVGGGRVRYMCMNSRRDNLTNSPTSLKFGPSQSQIRPPSGMLLRMLSRASAKGIFRKLTRDVRGYVQKVLFTWTLLVFAYVASAWESVLSNGSTPASTTNPPRIVTPSL